MKVAWTLAAVLAVASIAQTARAKETVNGSSDGVIASGVWQESHEGVGLYCVHVTNAVEVTKGHSESACFMTEVQAIAKDAPDVTTNVLVVQEWDDRGLKAITTFYADKNGNETTPSAPGSIKYTFRVVVDFAAHSVTKYLETPTKTLGFHLK